MNKYFYFLLLLLFSISLFAQEIIDKEVVTRFNNQLLLFPQEKLYLHTDKNIYVSGERIWFRAYLTDAALHTPSFESRYVYVELVDPVDSVVRRVKIRPVNDCYSGYLPIDDELPGGNYSLRAYTHFMENLPPDYFFHKQIRIGNAGYERIQLEKEFNYNADKGRMYVLFSFPDNGSTNKTSAAHVILRYKNRDLDVRYSNSDRKYRAYFYPDTTVNTPLYLEFGNYKCYLDVPSPNESRYHVGFYPEGGRLVSGNVCKVGFKALDADGLGLPVSGYIEDDLGERPCTFTTLHKGMGSFLLRPVPGRTYHAVCTDTKGREQRFELPKAEADFPTLKVENRRGRLLVGMQTTENHPKAGLSLVLHTRGLVHYAGSWQPDKECYSFDSSKFPSGVLSVLLLDQNLHPVSERLLFCRNNDQAAGNLKTWQDSYPLRSKVRNSFSAHDHQGRLQNGWASVSVTRDEEVEPDSCSSLLSYMLLSSDLRGYIEDASYYFRNPEDESRTEALDALMLTQGWRRYNVPSLLQGNYAVPTKELEVGSQVSGTVRNVFFNKLYEGATLGLLVPQFNYANIAVSDSLGGFTFTGFEFPDSTRYIVQAMKKNGKGISLQLEMDTDTFPSITKYFPATMESSSMDDDYGRYLENVRDKYPGTLMVNLAEVTVFGRKNTDVFTPTFAHNSNSYKTVTDKDIKEERYGTIFDILRRIIGVRVLSNNTVNIGNSMKSGLLATIGAPNTSMSGSTEGEGSILLSPLVILDGLPMERGYDLSQVNVSDIERLDVYRGVSAVLYGPDGSAGVISITTKRGKFDPNEKDIRFHIQELDKVLQGYQKSAQFYSPVYAPDQTNNRPDPRTTIYWNPDIRLNSSGDSSFDFYTADKPGTYTYIIEGVTEDGKLIHEEKSIRVED